MRGSGANLRMDRRVGLLTLWGALAYRRIFYPKATMWAKGADGKWHNVDDWSVTRDG
jgi:hypothetical protein